MAPLPPPLPRDIPNRAYLCHRGVDPSLVTAPADDFRHVLGCEVIIQEGDGLALSWSEFRELARKHLEEGRCDFLIALLNQNFPGPVYRKTLSIVERAKYTLPKSWTEVVRIDDCIGISERCIDIASDMTAAQRRSAIKQGQGRRFG